MGGYGAEFVNFREDVLGEAPPEDDVAIRLRVLMEQPGVSFIYFAPRTQIAPPDPAGPLRVQPRGYLISEPARGRSSRLPAAQFPDGVVRHVVVIPEHITLWFGPGAFLELDGRVALVVRGSIRAEPQMIFSLPDVRRLRSDISTPTSIVPRSQSIVRLESTQIEEIYPEWFGVRSLPTRQGVSSVDAPANSRALQACFHAACRDRTRGGVSLPPLTVVCRGTYCINETMEALPTINGHGALWLRGRGDTSTRSQGIPSLQRYAIGARVPSDPSPGDPRSPPLRTESGDSALIRVHPRVSLEVEGVGMVCHALRYVEDRGEEPEVRNCVLIEGERDGVAPLASRSVTIERCGLTGGTRAIVAIEDRRRPVTEVDLSGQPPVVPGVSGSLSGREVPFDVSRVQPWERSVAAPPLRHRSRRGARVRILGCSLDGVLRPLVRASPPGILRPISARSSRRMIDADLADASMLSIVGGKIHQAIGPSYGAQLLSVRGSQVTWGIIDLEAGVYLRGGATMVRAVSFHLSEGPRPSRPPDESHLPDGQDLWLDSGPDGTTITHLTVLHADSQSWWFLGGTRNLSVDPTAAVSLLNVGANDVNLKVMTTSDGPTDDLNEPYRAHVALNTASTLYQPPTVAWPGGEVPLLLEGCHFGRYCTTPENGNGSIVNVGTSFREPVRGSIVNWYPPTAVPRRRDRLQQLHASNSVAVSGRPIPDGLGVALASYYPRELVGRSLLDDGNS